MNRVGNSNWREYMPDVLQDIEKAGGVPALNSIEPTAGGTILEAENSILAKGKVDKSNLGFTGTGYVEFTPSSDASIEWIFEAPADGIYTLEFRYALPEGERSVMVSVNGQPRGEVVFWMTSGNSVWMWDRKNVYLSKGENKIQLSTVSSLPNMDHINILYSGRF
jgi:hypothetical protein